MWFHSYVFINYTPDYTVSGLERRQKYSKGYFSCIVTLWSQLVIKNLKNTTLLHSYLLGIFIVFIKYMWEVGLRGS